MALQIITDTSCDLPDRELKQYGIKMIPLKVTFENGETFLDRFEIPPALFVKKMKESKLLPKTSAPDPQAFMEYFEQGLKNMGEVLFISLSSGLSSTYQTAQLACKLLGSEKVKIFDSLTASLGTGIAAVKAAQMAARGLSLEAIVETLVRIRESRQVIFTLDTLENVVKGGRLSRVEGFTGNLLNIKPILLGNNKGVPEVIEKVRGRKKAVQRMVNLLGELVGSSVSKRIIGISHVECEEEAQCLRQALVEQYQPENSILIAPMSATIGIYAGVGGLMVNL